MRIILRLPVIKLVLSPDFLILPTLYSSADARASLFTSRPAFNFCRFLQRRNSMKSRSKDLSKTTWYDKPDRLNSRHSLETDEEISTDEEVFENVQDVENPDGLGEGRSGLINKLFHSTPSLAKKEYAAATVRPRAPTNEKLEKYKFMLINIGKLIFKACSVANFS